MGGTVGDKSYAGIRSKTESGGQAVVIAGAGTAPVAVPIFDPVFKRIGLFGIACDAKRKSGG